MVVVGWQVESDQELQDRLAAHAAPGESLLLPQQPPPRCLLSTLTTSYAIFKHLEGKGVMYYVHALRGTHSSCLQKDSLQRKTFCGCDHHNWKPLITYTQLALIKVQTSFDYALAFPWSDILQDLSATSCLSFTQINTSISPSLIPVARLEAQVAGINDSLGRFTCCHSQTYVLSM